MQVIIRPWLAPAVSPFIASKDEDLIVRRKEDLVTIMVYMKN